MTKQQKAVNAILIPTKAIDIGHNKIDVSKYTYITHKTTLRIDKLSLVSHYPKQNELYERLANLKSNNLYCVNHYPAKGKIEKLYTRCITIKLRDKSREGITIHYQPKCKGIGDIRFELSPQHILPNRIDKLIFWLAKSNRIGNMIFELLQQAWVTRIDFAMDFYGVSTFDYYFSLQGAKIGQITNKDINNGFGGLRLGSYKSSLHAAIYDKIAFSLNGMNDNEDDTYSVDLLQNQDLKFMRIEIRISSKNKSMKLSELSNLANPFEKIRIYHRNVEYKLLKHEKFVSLLRTMTIPEAMKHIEKRREKSKIKKILEQSQLNLCSWEQLWKEQKLHCLSLLGILQQSHFWDEDIRKKRMKKLKKREKNR